MNIQDEVNRRNDGSIGLPCWNSPWSCLKNNTHYITIYIYIYSIDLKEIAPCFFIRQFQSAAMKKKGWFAKVGDFVDLLRRRMGLGWSSKQKAEAAKPWRATYGHVDPWQPWDYGVLSLKCWGCWVEAMARKMMLSSHIRLSTRRAPMDFHDVMMWCVFLLILSTHKVGNLSTHEVIFRKGHWFFSLDR